MFLQNHHKIDPTYSSIADIYYISAHTIDKIKYFFQHYKDLEKKQVKIGQLFGKSEAVTVYLISSIDFKTKTFPVKNKITNYFDKL
jgi:inorganic pyrophosphatase